MRNLKYVVGTTAASASLWLAPVAPVAADTNDSYNNSGNTSVVTNTDASKSITIGDCVVFMDDIKAWLVQANVNLNGQANVDTDLEGGLPYLNKDEGGPRGGHDDGNSTDQTNNNGTEQSNNGSIVITVAPDCSVTNVTKVQQATAVQGAQTDAPKGGVGAGIGAGASLFASTFAAVSALGAGLGIRRFGN